jgi:hypothetical protein
VKNDTLAFWLAFFLAGTGGGFDFDAPQQHIASIVTIMRAVGRKEVMSALQKSLRRFLAVEGVRTAALVDIATGMIVRSVGKADPDVTAAAVCVADEARAARAAMGADSLAGDLDLITTVTASRLHVSQVLGTQPGEGLLLFVDIERTRSNVGLASLRVGQLAPMVLA